jgi:formyltetrahydrofolate hydrolase
VDSLTVHDCNPSEARDAMSPRSEPGHRFDLTLSYPAPAGLAPAVSGFLITAPDSIVKSQQSDDRLRDRLSMRCTLT